MVNVELWQELGKQFRVDSVRSSDKAGSGHPTSSMSAADLMAVLISNYLQYDFKNPNDPNNDHLVFSKGHASPLLYAMFKAAQAISDEEMLNFRKFGVLSKLKIGSIEFLHVRVFYFVRFTCDEAMIFP